MSECEKCGAKLPPKPAHQIIHVQQEHPDLYTEMVASYKADVEEWRKNNE